MINLNTSVLTTYVLPDFLKVLIIDSLFQKQETWRALQSALGHTVVCLNIRTWINLSLDLKRIMLLDNLLLYDHLNVRLWKKLAISRRVFIKIVNSQYLFVKMTTNYVLE